MEEDLFDLEETDKRIADLLASLPAGSLEELKRDVNRKEFVGWIAMRLGVALDLSMAEVLDGTRIAIYG